MGAVFYVAIFYIFNMVVLSQTSRDSQAGDYEDGIRFLRDLEGTRRGLQSLKGTIHSIDDDLATYQKRTCSLGINSHYCALANLDRVMQSSEWLNSAHSPGKRSQVEINDPVLEEQLQRVLEELVKKREDLATLKQLLEQADVQLSTKQKRTCRLNLGGACRTELASAIADQYYYLNSPHSPGKRRRRRQVDANVNSVADDDVNKMLDGSS